MSLWTKIRNAVAPIVRGVAAVYTGGASEAVWQIGEAASNARRAALDQAAAQRNLLTNPWGGVGSVGNMGAIIPAARLAGGAIVRGASTAIRSAQIYCRRNPGWCASLAGGIPAIAQMVQGGQLPPIKRRRRRGITATELGHFRRVSHVLNKWCKTPPPTKPRRSARSC